MASTELRAARWENQGEPFPFFRQLNDFASYPDDVGTSPVPLSIVPV
jgi:hypothetical protein